MLILTCMRPSILLVLAALTPMVLGCTEAEEDYDCSGGQCDGLADFAKANVSHSSETYYACSDQIGLNAVCFNAFTHGHTLRFPDDFQAKTFVTETSEHDSISMVAQDNRFLAPADTAVNFKASTGAWDDYLFSDFGMQLEVRMYMSGDYSEDRWQLLGESDVYFSSATVNGSTGSIEGTQISCLKGSCNEEPYHSTITPIETELSNAVLEYRLTVVPVADVLELEVGTYKLIFDVW